MPSVLVFGEYGVRNGGENSFLATVPFLRKAGWEVSAAVPNESEFFIALDQAGVTVYPLWLTGLGGERLSQEQIRHSMANVINETKPELVHANSLSTSRLLGPVAKELGVPSVGHLRDIIRCSAKAISDINCLDRIIAVSKATMNYHASMGMDDSKLRVVYNGVDTKRFTPPEIRPRLFGAKSSLRQELDLASNAFLALYVGQIGMRKGIIDALETMREPIAQREDVHFLLVGERHSRKDEAIEYEKQCHQLADEIGNVHWLGRRTDVSELMQQCDLLVHMPRQEPLGRVLLESAASGLPIVTTDVGGTREILSEFEHLIISKRDSYQGCFDFDQFYSNAEFYRKTSVALREMALARFPDHLAGENVAKQYSEALALGE